MNEEPGKVRDWILFWAGLAMVAAFMARWWQTGGDPPYVLGGLALAMMGMGGEVAQWLINRRNGK